MDDEQLAPTPHTSILEVGQRQVIDAVAALGDDDKAAAVATADQTGIRGGIAVDVGKGVKLGIEGEKSATGWRWFVGGMWRKKKS